MQHDLPSWLANHVDLILAVALVVAFLVLVVAASMWLGRSRAINSDTEITPPQSVALDRHDLPAIFAVGAAAAALSAVILSLKASTPLWDDGAIIVAQRLPMTVHSVLTPYHEHLDVVPIVLWGGLYRLFGSTSGPFLALLLLTHVALATGTAALLVARVGRVAGFALALPLALLGSAHYDLLMPFQIVFTIPLLCGLVAVWFSIPRERTPLRWLMVAVSLVVAVLSSDVGLFVVFGLGVWFLLNLRWRQIWELVPAGTVWLIWFVKYGRTGLGDDGLGSATIGSVVPYTIAGITSGLGGLVGLGQLAGGLILVGAIVLLVVRRPHLDPAFLGFALAVVVMFAIGSLFRSYGAAAQATTPRYIYLVAYLLAFGVAAAAPKLTHQWRLVPVAVLAAGLNLVALAVALPTYP